MFKAPQELNNIQEAEVGRSLVQASLVLRTSYRTTRAVTQTNPVWGGGGVGMWSQ